MKRTTTALGVKAPEGYTWERFDMKNESGQRWSCYVLNRESGSGFTRGRGTVHWQCTSLVPSHGAMDLDATPAEETALRSLLAEVRARDKAKELELESFAMTRD